MVIKIKPCKWCEGTNHQSFQCFKRPKKPAKIGVADDKKFPPFKKRKPIKSKPDYKWLATRRLWFRENPADHSGFYYCKITPCLLPGVPMLRAEVELDHIIARSHDLSLKYVLSNLRPSHGLCNREKGSLSDEKYKEKIARRYL